MPEVVPYGILGWEPMSPEGAVIVSPDDSPAPHNYPDTLRCFMRAIATLIIGWMIGKRQMGLETIRHMS